MTRFYPLYVRRSDGKVEVTAKGKRQELNQPTSEQLDQKPDKNGVSDYYREVSIDETKHLDWRRKLGGMLAREMDWKEKSTQAGQGTHAIILYRDLVNRHLINHASRHWVYAGGIS